MTYRSLSPALEQKLAAVELLSVCSSCSQSLSGFSSLLSSCTLFYYFSSVPYLWYRWLVNVTPIHSTTRNARWYILMSWHEAKSSNWSTSIMAQIFLSELRYTGTFRSWLISWYQRLEFLRRPRSNARKYQVLESEGCHGKGSCVYPRWQFDCDGSWWQEYRSCQRTSKFVRVHWFSPIR